MKKKVVVACALAAICVCIPLSKAWSALYNYKSGLSSVGGAEGALDINVEVADGTTGRVGLSNFDAFSLSFTDSNGSTVLGADDLSNTSFLVIGDDGRVASWSLITAQNDVVSFGANGSSADMVQSADKTYYDFGYNQWCQVPVNSSWVLLGAGMVGLMSMRRQRPKGKNGPHQTAGAENTYAL